MKKLFLILFILIFSVITWFFILFLEFPTEIIVQVMFWLILGITVISIGKLYLDLYKSEGEIQVAVDFLKNFAVHKNDKSIDQSEFEKIDEHFKEQDELINVWYQYEGMIRRIKDNSNGEKKNKYFATIDASYFFDELFLTSQVNIKLYKYIPQLLIALGIFGTFLGLVLGLEGLEIHSAEQTQNSIELLIDGVNLSFLTSLYGIAYSILFTFFQKWFVGGIVTKMNSLASQLDLIFPKNTQEDGVKELYNELKKQTGSLESMATDFAEVVDKKISATLNEKLGPTLEKLGASAERLADISESTNQNNIEKLIENTGEIISSATKDEISKLTESLSVVTSKNEELFSNFAESIVKIENMIENQEEVINQTNDSAINVKKTNENVVEIVKELEGSLNGLKNLTNTQEKTIQSYQQLMENIKFYIEEQAKSNEQIASTLEDNYKIVEKQTTLNKELNQVTNNFKEAGQILNPFLDNLGTNMENFDKLSKNINQRLVSSISNLEDYYQKINNEIAVILENLADSVDKIDNNVITSLNDINQNYEQISAQLVEFSRESNQLIQSMKEFSSTQQSTHNLWESYKDSFDKLNQNLEEGVIEYTSNVRSGINNILGEYDSHIENVLENFNATINQFTDTIEELNDMLYELEKNGKERTR